MTARRNAKYIAITYGLAVVLLYNDWLLAPFFNPAISTRLSLISEISAQSQPFHWVFQILDIAAGLLTLIALPWIWRLLRRSRIAYQLLSFALITCIGADSILDALLPISCAPSVDTGCSLANGSLVTHAHLFESTLIGILIFVAPIVWWRSCRRRHTGIAHASSWFAMLQVVVGVGIVLTHWLGHDITGLWQRSYEFGIGAWIATIVHTALAARIARPVEHESRTSLLAPDITVVPIED